jgi:AmiR/NasT family two-component response regulator
VLPLSVGDEDPQALADREVIGRAEGILMKRGGLDEEGACRRLRKLARDHNQKSQMILRAGEAFQPPAP